MPDRFQIESQLEGTFSDTPVAHNEAHVRMEKGASGVFQIVAPGPQWSYAASWARQGELPPAPIIVELDVEVSGACIGVGFIGFDNSYVGEEAGAEPSRDLQTLRVIAEVGSEVSSMVLRNTDIASNAAQIVVRGIRVYHVALSPRQLYVIYAPGKLATQTIEASIRASDKRALVERHHFLSDEAFEEVENVLRASRDNDLEATSLSHQLEVAREAKNLLRLHDRNSTWIINGFRDPLERALSSFFQLLAYFCPNATLDPEHIDADVQYISDVFYAEFDKTVQRRRHGVKARNLREFRADGVMTNLDDWYQRELRSVFGLDVFSLDLQGPFHQIDCESRHMLIYRFEELREQLGRILEVLPSIEEPRVASKNETAHKPSAALYAAVKRSFVPTSEMLEYYYSGSKFFRHAYGGKVAQP